MADELALQGVAQLVVKLRELGAMEDGKIIQGAVRAGMRPALVSARQKIPVGTIAHRTYKGRLVAPGFAKRSLRIVAVLSKDKQQATALLGPSKEGYYATQFLERGTFKMKAQPWLRPAFYGTGEQQKTALAAYLNKWFLKKATETTSGIK